MAKLAVVVLFAAALCVSGARSTSAQGTAAEDFKCPEQWDLTSENPFTMEEVEELVGFNHWLLQEIVDAPRYIPGPPWYLFYLSCTPYNGTTYVGLLYLSGDGYLEMRVGVLSLQSGQVWLVATHNMETLWAPHCMGLSGFADRNFNGMPDFVVSGCDGGTKGWYSGLRLLEIGEDGDIHDITPVGGDIGPNGFDDLNSDGIPEIHDAYFYFVPMFPSFSVGVQRLDQWWQWDGVGYRTVAVQLYSFRYEQNGLCPGCAIEDSGNRIDEYLTELSTTQIYDAVSQESTDEYGGLRWHLFHILMYYNAWGMLDMGWEKIQPAIDAAKACENSDAKTLFLNAMDEYETYFADWRRP